MSTSAGSDAPVFNDETLKTLLYMLSHSLFASGEHGGAFKSLTADLLPRSWKRLK